MGVTFKTIYDIWPNADEPAARQRETYPEIADELFWELYEIAKPYTMLSIPALYNLFQSLRYIEANRLPGDLVECGVFLGGASIFMALMRKQLGLGDRIIHGFDTFTGFPEGSEDVRREADGVGYPYAGVSFDSTYDAVVDNFTQTCGMSGIEFHVGLVEETLPRFAARPLALLRLDTDFYDSTKVELELMYPMLSPGGVLIIDDYGWFEGSRRATDEYFGRRATSPLLNRIDEGVWAGVKPAGV